MKSLHFLRKLPSLAQAGCPGSSWKHRVTRFKYVIRGVVFMPHTAHWYFLLQHPCWEPLIENFPSVYSKLHRPYLCRSDGPSKTLQVLRHHYDFVQSKISCDSLPRIYRAGGLELASLCVEGLGSYSLKLSYMQRFERDGDLVISLVNQISGLAVCHLAFVVSHFRGGRVDVCIGSLQGNKRLTEKGQVVVLTRKLHGLRPKALLLFVLQELFRLWGATSLRAVSLEEHVCSHWLRKKRIHADYNQFWEESGGKIDSTGFFNLPLVTSKRDITKLKPNKRPVYRRRYEMLDALSQQLARRWQLAGEVRTEEIHSEEQRNKESMSSSITMANSFRS